MYVHSISDTWKLFGCLSGSHHYSVCHFHLTETRDVSLDIVARILARRSGF
jgi:hypothetical protein